VVDMVNFFDLKIMERKITHFVRTVEINARSLLCNYIGMSTELPHTAKFIRHAGPCQCP
jgi:hypothetical protein